MNPETRKLNQKLVLSSMSCIESWEQWADAVPAGPAKTLHLSLIRLTKGLVKAWRLFLVESQEQPTSQPDSSQHVLLPSDHTNQ